jgi:ribonuclease P protein component
VRRPTDDGSATIGLGFTATKRLGGAVVRNRAKRRLKEAARLTLPDGAQPGLNYVLIARPRALTCAFTKLMDDLQRAFAGVTRRLEGRRRDAGPSAS